MPRPCLSLHAEPLPAVCPACRRVADAGPVGAHYRRLWGEEAMAPRNARPAPAAGTPRRTRPCLFLRDVISRMGHACPKRWLRGCDVHGRCATDDDSLGVAVCQTCEDYTTDD